jgi:hypothetical protein
MMILWYKKKDTPMDNEPEETKAKREYLARQRSIGQKTFAQIARPGNPVYEFSRTSRETVEKT